jgi:hypothetical protein
MENEQIKRMKKVLVVDDEYGSSFVKEPFLYETAKNFGYCPIEKNGRSIKGYDGLRWLKDTDEGQSVLRNFYKKISESYKGALRLVDIEEAIKNASGNVQFKQEGYKNKEEISRLRTVKDYLTHKGIDLKFLIAEPFVAGDVLKKILAQNYDILLLDMGFPCSQEEINFLVKKDQRIKKYKDIYGFNPGGIYVANGLKELNRKFTFWTMDLGHSEINRGLAAYLNLLSDSTITEAEVEDKNQYEIDQWDRMSSDQKGKLIISRKNIFEKPEKFTKIVRKAHDWQSQ